MTEHMADSVTASDLPAGLDYYAAYVNGQYQATMVEVAQRFPSAQLLTIDVLNEGVGMCLDVERGDATPFDVAGWVARRLAHIKFPVVYASRDLFPAIPDGFFLRWSAHYTGTDHICSPSACGASFTADATQWSDHGPKGEHYDRSTLSDHFVSMVWNTTQKVGGSVAWIARAHGDGRVYHCSRENGTKLYIPTDTVEACDAYVEALRDPNGQPFVWPVEYMDWLVDITPHGSPPSEPSPT